ncbi:hypothetical protein [Methanolapillus millepedarum]|uniref:Uncharacterized protein n=1 Tax=Methanolapillus millepedarum TaxID=3028296 RepID=A0AA96V166_9EURY|nr:hypothetical protein MsAc7_00290 [Methanosarcinaceae archaeon Ac7]
MKKTEKIGGQNNCKYDFHEQEYNDSDESHPYYLDEKDDDADHRCGCSNHDDEDHLKDIESKILVSKMISYLDEFEKLSFGATYSEFIKNESLQTHLVSLLSKTQKKALFLDPDFIDRHPKTDWKSLQTIEDQVVHPVYGLNPETLWDLIRLDIPFLNRRLNVVINGCCHNH